MRPLTGKHHAFVLASFQQPTICLLCDKLVRFMPASVRAFSASHTSSCGRCCSVFACEFLWAYFVQARVVVLVRLVLW